MEKNNRSLAITRILDAPIDLVFRAWTDPKQIAQWWGPKDFTDTVTEWDARPGGKLSLVMHGPGNMDHPIKGVFREVIEPTKIEFTAIAFENEKGEFLLENLNTITLAEENGKTKMTLKVTVLRAEPGTEEGLKGMEEGWSQSLDKLNKFIEKPGAPLIVERTFDAPVEKVWKAITERDQMKQWYFDLADFKPEPGFEFEFIAGDDKKKFLHLCKVTEAIPNKKIAYTWRYDGEPGNSTVTWELFDEEGKTKLKLTHEGLETFPPVQDFAKKNFYGGWTHILGISLKKYLDK